MASVRNLSSAASSDSRRVSGSGEQSALSSPRDLARPGSAAHLQENGTSGDYASLRTCESRLARQPYFLSWKGCMQMQPCCRLGVLASGSRGSVLDVIGRPIGVDRAMCPACLAFCSDAAGSHLRNWRRMRSTSANAGTVRAVPEDLIRRGAVDRAEYLTACPSALSCS